MPKRYIILKPIGNNKGSGVVTLSGENITVSLSGTDEEFLLYFLSSEIGKDELKINAGNIKGGFAKSFTLKEGDVRRIDTVVLLKGSEPFIYGSVSEGSKEKFFEELTIEKGDEKDGAVPEIEGFTWKKIDDGSFAENCPIVRHIFDNINVLYKIYSGGFYYYGINGNKVAVAIPAEKNEKNPFTHISDCARFIEGCWTVGVDKKEKYFYSLRD